MKIKLSARAYIYPIIVLLVCFFMYQHNKKLAANIKRTNETRPVAVGTSHAMPIDTEMSSAPLADKPVLYLFGSKEEIPFADELRTELQGKCSVLHILTTADDVRQYFQIKAVPCALLFDKDHQEIQRVEPLTDKEGLLSELQM